MIYEFKSRAAGTVVMTQGVAENILELIGKSPGPQGVITVEQIPAAIQTLEAAIARSAADKAARKVARLGEKTPATKKTKDAPSPAKKAAKSKTPAAKKRRRSVAKN